MSRTTLVLVAALLSLAGSASALNNRSAVSVTGVDTNPCTTAMPCRSFGAAISVTAAGGEVIALDSAGYGAFTINQSVTVTGAPGVHAAISVLTGDAITVSSGNPVVIGNLYILGQGSGTNGINNTGATILQVQECFIQGFIGHGILAGSGSGETVVDDTTLQNDATGVAFDNAPGTVDSSNIDACITGISIVNSSATLQTGVISTKLRYNNTGISFSGTATGSPAFVMVDRSSLFGNITGIAVSGSNGGALVAISNDLIDSITVSGLYQISTFGNNVIFNTTATLSPVGLR